MAYHLKDAQLVGLPKWADSLRFDMQAKAVEANRTAMEDLTDDQLRAMLQPILADRFQLKFHYETKVLPAYYLVLGRNGPKFQESKITGDQEAANGMVADNLRLRNTVMTSTAIPMSRLVDLLSSQLQRIVIDKTGLTGK